VISHDDDFESLGFEGNGTEVSPYLIEDLSISIDGSSETICIKIVSTSLYFIIQNCELSSSDPQSGTGIYLEKVVNGRVENCSFNTLVLGIWALKSQECVLLNSTINNLSTGIYITQSSWFTVVSNEISGCKYGLHLYKMDYSSLMGNIINDCDYGILVVNGVEIQTLSNDIRGSTFGIYFHGATRCKSIDNLVEFSNYGLYLAYSTECNSTFSKYSRNRYGVYLLDVNDGVISSNRVESNSENGIHFKDCKDIIVLSNIVFENKGIGIYLNGVVGATINGNEIGFSRGANAADFVGSSIRGIVNNWDTNAWSDFHGASQYSIVGDRNSIDNNPQYILFLDSPSDMKSEAPATGSITWQASSFKPGYFSIKINDIIVREDVWDGESISYVFEDFDPGVYSFVLTVSSASGIDASDTVILNVQDTTAPIWVQLPENQIVECGSPLSYWLNATDHYGIVKWWVNRTDFNIENGFLKNSTSLLLGTYYLEVRVYDPSDNFAAASLTINVIDSILPYVDLPNDIVLFENSSGYSIVWNVFDYNPFSYEILINGISIEGGNWTNEMTSIQYSLDELSVGTYVVTIILTDSAGNSKSDDVQVTVEASTTTQLPTTEEPETTTPLTETETYSPTDGGMGEFSVVTMGVLCIGSIVVVVIIFLLRKRSR
jgi:parallel beta-helix repeat protein